jgi:hypothetical protein
MLREAVYSSMNRVNLLRGNLDYNYNEYLIKLIII